SRAAALTWEKCKGIRDLTRMNVVLRGMRAWEDAKLAAENGYDGIIVSNHGGRAGDLGRSSIDALPEIIEAAGSMPVLIDSGFRPGTDIAQAPCMRAKVVAVGRPSLGVLGAVGQAGVEGVLAILRSELGGAMQQVGAPTIKHLVPAMVRRA